MTDLYYAELLMDSGCTPWASLLVNYIQGDEIVARKDLYVQSVSTDSQLNTEHRQRSSLNPQGPENFSRALFHSRSFGDDGTF